MLNNSPQIPSLFCPSNSNDLKCLTFHFLKNCRNWVVKISVHVKNWLDRNLTHKNSRWVFTAITDQNLWFAFHLLFMSHCLDFTSNSWLHRGHYIGETATVITALQNSLLKIRQHLVVMVLFWTQYFSFAFNPISQYNNWGLGNERTIPNWA